LVGDGEHYELSKKTKSRKGEQMKRLALLSVFSLMLASAVFAPVALAQEVGEVDVQSVRLGPGGSVIATGTFQCFQDWQYYGNVTVRQKTSGNVYNTASFNFSGTCNGSELIPFTLSGFSDKPFHGGKAAVQANSSLYEPVSGTSFSWSGAPEAFRLR
jgi:hypothetical protein